MKFTIFLLIAFSLMMGFGILSLGASAHHSSSGCAFSAVLGDCAPSDDILALITHHSEAYFKTTLAVPVLLALSIIFSIFAFFRIRCGPELGRRPVFGGILNVRSRTNPFNWLSDLRFWLILRRTDALAN